MNHLNFVDICFLPETSFRWKITKGFLLLILPNVGLTPGQRAGSSERGEGTVPHWGSLRGAWSWGQPAFHKARLWHLPGHRLSQDQDRAVGVMYLQHNSCENQEGLACKRLPARQWKPIPQLSGRQLAGLQHAQAFIWAVTVTAYQGFPPPDQPCPPALNTQGGSPISSIKCFQNLTVLNSVFIRVSDNPRFVKEGFQLNSHSWCKT